MTKQEIIEHLTHNCGLHRSSAIKAVDGFIGIVSQSLADGNDVTLRGFGTFRVKDVPEKIGRNIALGTEVAIPAHRSVKFVLSKDLKEKLNP